jgi:DNA helicase-2/ATP-dependent DNA helicase PcrA
MHLRGLPSRISDETPALVTRFKTHTALLKMIDRAGVARKGSNVVETFDELLTDRSWIRSGLTQFAPGDFSDDEVAKIHRWCTDSHVRRVDNSEKGDDPPCLDAEDDAILLRLYQTMVGRLRFVRSKGGRGPILSYDHIMVDEAQDLSPLEIAVAVDTANHLQSVTLAGDVAQTVAEHRQVQSWEDVLDALRMKHLRISPLEVSYRSTSAIMEVAHDILGPYAPAEMATTTRQGAPVAHLAFGELGEAVAWVAEALTDLVRREPLASVALLAPTLARGAAWFKALERSEVPNIHMVDDQDFSFAPGIEVTDIRSSKGLEFDYVLVLDADDEAFPVTASARHLLHVATTRAAHQLWFISTGRPSLLLPASLSGLLDP